MKELRLFIAVAPSGPARRSIVAVQTLMRERLGDAAVRWVREANLHVTLQFLGSTGATDLDRVVAALRAAAGTCPGPIRLELAAPGAFPNARRPRTLWVGVDDPDGRLARVARRLRDELRAAGFKPDDKPLRPHVTIGYLRKRVAAAERAAVGAVVERTEAPQASFAASEIVLMESVLQAGGSQYTPLETIGVRR